MKKISECSDEELENYMRKLANNSYKHHKRKKKLVDLKRKDFYNILKRDIHKGCSYCGCEYELFNGGRYNPSGVSFDVINPHFPTISDWNLQLLCIDCNTTKGHHSHEEFMKYCLNMGKVAQKEIIGFYKELGDSTHGN